MVEPRIPVEPLHPSVFIQEEMDVLGWSCADLANRMGMESCVRNKFALDLYFAAGPTNPSLRLGDVAERLGRAFGVSPDLFWGLEAAWLADLGLLPPSDQVSA